MLKNRLHCFYFESILNCFLKVFLRFSKESFHPYLFESFFILNQFLKYNRFICFLNLLFKVFLLFFLKKKAFVTFFLSAFSLLLWLTCVFSLALFSSRRLVRGVVRPEPSGRGARAHCALARGLVAV